LPTQVAVAFPHSVVCFEGRSYFSEEVFVNLFDLYLDNDVGDSQILLGGKDYEVGIKSVSDNDLYVGNAPSRALEADGNLTDGYATYCTSWFTLPNDVVGGNAWDVQGRATLDPSLYSLSADKNWDWESDEFPIFGLFTKYPTWDLHLFEPIHYRIPERWDRITPSQYAFNLSIPPLGSGARNFNFGEHLPFRLLDENTPFERLINVTITYQNGSEIYHNISLFTQFEEIIVLIENVNTSRDDNNFTLTAYNFDYTNRTVVALETIANKTGTFQLSIDCPNQAEIGSTIKCAITARIEQSQTVEKEVDFNCFIDGDISTLNFNQMVTRTPITLIKEFNVPSTFEDNSPHTVICQANYFNFGSRQDTFSDTFIADASGGTPTGAGDGEPGLISNFLTLVDTGLKKLQENFLAVILAILFVVGLVLLVKFLPGRRKSNQIY